MFSSPEASQCPGFPTQAPPPWPRRSCGESGRSFSMTHSGLSSSRNGRLTPCQATAVVLGAGDRQPQRPHMTRASVTRTLLAARAAGPIRRPAWRRTRRKGGRTAPSTLSAKCARAAWSAWSISAHNVLSATRLTVSLLPGPRGPWYLPIEPLRAAPRPPALESALPEKRLHEMVRRHGANWVQLRRHLRFLEAFFEEPDVAVNGAQPPVRKVERMAALVAELAGEVQLESALVSGATFPNVSRRQARSLSDSLSPSPAVAATAVTTTAPALLEAGRAIDRLVAAGLAAVRSSSRSP